MLTVHEAATGGGKNTAWWAGEFVYECKRFCERGRLMLMIMMQGSRIYSGGAIERMALRGLLRRRFFLFVVRFSIYTSGVLLFGKRGGEG